MNTSTMQPPRMINTVQFITGYLIAGSADIGQVLERDPEHWIKDVVLPECVTAENPVMVLLPVKDVDGDLVWNMNPLDELPTITNMMTVTAMYEIDGNIYTNVDLTVAVSGEFGRNTFFAQVTEDMYEFGVL